MNILCISTHLSRVDSMNILCISTHLSRVDSMKVGKDSIVQIVYRSADGTPGSYHRFVSPIYAISNDHKGVVFPGYVCVGIGYWIT